MPPLFGSSRPRPRPASAMRRHPDYKVRGEIVELAFAHRAAALGLIVSKPYGDSAPYDFVVEGSGILRRVQVRSVGSRGWYGTYQVNASYGACRQHPLTPDQIEIIAAYIKPDDVWYLIPADALQGRKTVRLGGPRRILECFRERWTVLGAPQRDTPPGNCSS